MCRTNICRSQMKVPPRSSRCASSESSLSAANPEWLNSEVGCVGAHSRSQPGPVRAQLTCHQEALTHYTHPCRRPAGGKFRPSAPSLLMHHCPLPATQDAKRSHRPELWTMCTLLGMPGVCCPSIPLAWSLLPINSTSHSPSAFPFCISTGCTSLTEDLQELRTA